MSVKKKCTVPVLPLLVVFTVCMMSFMMLDRQLVPGLPQIAENITGNYDDVKLNPSQKQISGLKSDPRHQSWPKKNVTSKSKKGVFVLKPNYNGRLGNYMFLYAAVYALAVSKNMSVYVEGKNRLRRIFRLDPQVVTNRECSKWHSVSSPCCDYDPTLEQRIAPDRCQRVGEYLQSWKYFEKYSEAIHRSFRFLPNVEKSARTKISFLIETYKKKGDNVTNTTDSQNITLIGIHARRGDFLSGGSKKQGRIIPPAGYFLRAMEYFRKRFPNPIFLAASDSVSWLKQNLKSKDVIITGGKSPEEDLCMLSMCNHTIMSVGTFGWWGGYLARGTTLYYNKKAKSNTNIAKLYKNYETDFMLKNWIGME